LVMFFIVRNCVDFIGMTLLIVCTGIQFATLVIAQHLSTWLCQFWQRTRSLAIRTYAGVLSCISHCMLYVVKNVRSLYLSKSADTLVSTWDNVCKKFFEVVGPIGFVEGMAWIVVCTYFIRVVYVWATKKRTDPEAYTEEDKWFKGALEALTLVAVVTIAVSEGRQSALKVFNQVKNLISLAYTTFIAVTFLHELFGLAKAEVIPVDFVQESLQAAVVEVNQIVERSVTMQNKPQMIPHAGSDDEDDNLTSDLPGDDEKSTPPNSSCVLNGPPKTAEYRELERMNADKATWTPAWLKLSQTWDTMPTANPKEHEQKKVLILAQQHSIKGPLMCLLVVIFMGVLAAGLAWRNKSRLQKLGAQVLSVVSLKTGMSVSTHSECHFNLETDGLGCQEPLDVEGVKSVPLIAPVLTDVDKKKVVCFAQNCPERTSTARKKARKFNGIVFSGGGSKDQKSTDIIRNAAAHDTDMDVLQLVSDSDGDDNSDHEIGMGVSEVEDHFIRSHPDQRDRILESSNMFNVLVEDGSDGDDDCKYVVGPMGGRYAVKAGEKLADKVLSRPAERAKSVVKSAATQKTYSTPVVSPHKCVTCKNNSGSNSDCRECRETRVKRGLCQACGSKWIRSTGLCSKSTCHMAIKRTPKVVMPKAPIKVTALSVHESLNGGSTRCMEKIMRTTFTLLNSVNRAKISNASVFHSSVVTNAHSIEALGPLGGILVRGDGVEFPVPKDGWTKLENDLVFRHSGPLGVKLEPLKDGETATRVVLRTPQPGESILILSRLPGMETSVGHITNESGMVPRGHTAPSKLGFCGAGLWSSNTELLGFHASGGPVNGFVPITAAVLLLLQGRIDDPLNC